MARTDKCIRNASRSSTQIADREGNMGFACLSAHLLCCVVWTTRSRPARQSARRTDAQRLQGSNRFVFRFAQCLFARQRFFPYYTFNVVARGRGREGAEHVVVRCQPFSPRANLTESVNTNNLGC